MTLWERLAELKGFHLHGGKSARLTHVAFRAWTHDERGRSARVQARLKVGESIDQMLERALTELGRRVQDGMPKKRPRPLRKPTVRDDSPSRFVN